MAVLVDGTPFTIEFLLDKISPGENFPHFKDLESFEVKNITESAFMSSIYKVKLNWKTNKNAPRSVVLKVPGPHTELWENFLGGNEAEKDEASGTDPGMGNEAEKDETSGTDLGVSEFLEIAHSREIEFYKMFSAYKPKLKLPKFYYGYKYSKSNRDGLIIMEDMTQGSTIVKVLPGFNDVQILAVVDEIAKMQSISWKHPEWKQIVSQYSIELGFIREMKNVMSNLKTIKPDPFERLVEKITPIFDHYENIQTRGDYDEESLTGIPPCVVHADLWAPNLLWTKDSEGNPSNELAAIIDWQTVHPGNPCEDILRLISLNTSGEYRRNNTQRILKYYMERVEEYMNGKAPFTFDQLNSAYKNVLPFAALYLGFGAPLYYTMDSVVGVGEQRERNREELLSRVELFFEDTIDAFRDEFN